MLHFNNFTENYFLSGLVVQQAWISASNRYVLLTYTDIPAIPKRISETQINNDGKGVLIPNYIHIKYIFYFIYIFFN